MSTPLIKKLFNKQYLPATVLAILLIFVILMAVMPQLLQSKEAVSTTADQALLAAQLRQDTSKANVLKAALQLYYASTGNYPFNYDELTSYAENDQSGNWGSDTKKSLADAKKNLKDLDYAVRGDKQAYQFTYTDRAGKSVTVKGNYQNEYH